MKWQFAACRGLDLVPLVRVPATEYHFVARMLDAGAMGVMVPMVETAEQAARIVSFTRYPPQGRRGAAFGVAPHDDFIAAPVTATMAEAHERTLVICLVETETRHRNVDAIAATPGVDVVWLRQRHPGRRWPRRRRARKRCHAPTRFDRNGTGEAPRSRGR